MLRKRHRIPILVYHFISESEVVSPRNEEEFYTLSLSKFKEQLEFLYRHGYQSVTVDDLKDFKIGRKRMPRKPIIFTFDDGHISNYALAYPLLEYFMFKAVFFVICENIGKEGFMSWSELRRLSDNGIMIGSHGMTHRFLTRLSDEELRRELVDSKRMIENSINKPVRCLAVPGGFYNERVRRMAMEAGYEAICTSDFGLNYLDTDLTCLRRIGIRYNTEIGDFRRIFRQGILFMLTRRILWSARYILKSIIGVGNYTRIKEYLLRSRACR